MAIPLGNNLDFNGNQALNLVLQLLSSDPGSPATAQEWFNTTVHRFKGYDGTSVQTVAWWADSLDKFAAAAADISLNSHKITSLANPVAGTDAANKQYVDAAIQGLNVKLSVEWATTTALPAGTYSAGVFTGTSNGALSIDGGTPAVGDRVLVKNQVTGLQNQIYVVTQVGDGSHPPILTEAPDFATSADVTQGAYTFVTNGTANANTGWLLTTANPITLGTTALTWAQFNAAGGVTAGSGINVSGVTVSVKVDGVTIAVVSTNLSVINSTTAGQHFRSTGTATAAAPWITDEFAVSIGDGSTLSYTINHNLGSTDVLVQVRETGGSKRRILVEVDDVDSNNVAVVFSVAPATNAYRVFVKRIA